MSTPSRKRHTNRRETGSEPYAFPSPPAARIDAALAKPPGSRHLVRPRGGLRRQTTPVEFPSTSGLPARTRTLQRIVVALGVAFLLGMIFSFLALVHSGQAGPKQSDFLPYYAAVKMLYSGHAAAIYSLHEMGRVENALVFPLHVKNGTMPYLYPPHFALAMAPLFLLPYVDAYLVWLGCNVLLLLGCLYLLQRYLELHKLSAVVLWTSGLSFFPVLVALAQGQASIILLFLFLIVFIALKTNHNAAAGVFLALALIKEPYVLPIFILLLVSRRWPAIWSFVCATLVLTLGTVSVVGFSASLAYVHTLAAASTWREKIGGFSPHWNQSLLGFFQLLLSGGLATSLTWISMIVVMAALMWQGARTHDVDLSYGMGIVVALLISPHVLIHDLSLLLIPAAVAFKYRQRIPHVVALLAVGYVFSVAGLALSPLTHVQSSVVIMLILFGSLLYGAPAGQGAQPHPFGRLLVPIRRLSRSQLLG